MKFIEVTDSSGDKYLINLHDISLVIPDGNDWDSGCTILFRKGATQYTSLSVGLTETVKLKNQLLSA
ncbi:hypothetical protein [Stutzerimonas kunmingensis]|uniref:hypothetical protein n=1 Tax=Stutzerimonas kunmingensis TaxID=1211807 RepID=UPI001F3B030E|nr:hypothetical protein [Stutzerimonas kunmingensis]UIP32547.1 hypothetical protein LW136_20920 [Stutzerimonas kunmingensis]